MKSNTARISVILSIFVFGFAACKKDERSINLNVTAVTNLFAPADTAYIKLQPAANLTTTFSWDQARAEDGSLVLYEVAFDQADGDFSKPFYTVLSDNKGVSNQLTISHGDLNKIAALGGADFFQAKTFKWTVLATKGTNVKVGTVSRKITLERPAGFAVLPGKVYLSGTATENGDVLANALPMKQVSSGVFEIYTKLVPGNYSFYDANTGTPNKYYLKDQGGIKLIDVNGETTFTDTPQTVRLTIDFNNVNGNIVQIRSIQFWYCQANDFWFTLPYTSNGIWRYDNWPTTLISVAWGLEDRYKYKMVVNDGSGDKDQWINSNFGDPAGQDGQYPSSVEYRTLNLEKNDGSQYDWGWKFDRNYLAPQGSPVSYWVSFRATDPAYTQNYSK